MLRRDRQIRTQIHQLADACLFGLSFWMAFALRANPQIIAWLNLDPIPADVLNRVVWLYFALIPAAPLILESQGFYNRPVLVPAPGHSLAALQGLSHHDHRPGAGHVCPPLCFAPRGDGVFWRHQFHPGLSEGGTGAVGFAQQIRPVPIQTPLHPRRHRQAKSPDAARTGGTKRTTASRSWPN